MKLIRTSIVLCGLAALLPSPPDEAGASQTPAPSSMEMASAAASAVGDARGFCGRQPAVCETTRFVAHRLELKAKYAARLVYEWASDGKPAQPALQKIKPAKADPMTTGAAPATPLTVHLSQNTLRLEDLIPEWRSPLQARKS